MSYNTGYVTLPVTSYSAWKNATNGNGYNYDASSGGGFGCQCYDLVVEFWWNVGFPQGYPIISSSSAYTMWNNREQNKAYNGVVYFDLIYNLNDVKQGDVLVYAGTNSNPYGHVGFADQDYDTWTPDPSEPYEFPILSQNNGGTPAAQGGAYTNVHGYDTRLFLGAFRYRNWHTTPPSPPSPSHVGGIPNRNKFPFFITANRRRENW